MKAKFGNNCGHNYAVKINNLESNEFFRLPFGRQLPDLRKVEAFCKECKTTHVGAKGKATMSAVRKWIKEWSPTEFYAQWRKDSSDYKDDSVKLFFKEEA